MCEHHCLQNLWKHLKAIIPSFRGECEGPLLITSGRCIPYRSARAEGKCTKSVNLTNMPMMPMVQKQNHCAGGKCGFTLWSSNVAMEIHYEWSIFHGRVWLPEGTVYFNDIPLNFIKPPFIHIYPINELISYESSIKSSNSLLPSLQETRLQLTSDLLILGAALVQGVPKETAGRRMRSMERSKKCFFSVVLSFNIKLKYMYREWFSKLDGAHFLIYSF